VFPNQAAQVANSLQIPLYTIDAGNDTPMWGAWAIEPFVGAVAEQGRDAVAEVGVVVVVAAGDVTAVVGPALGRVDPEPPHDASNVAVISVAPAATAGRQDLIHPFYASGETG